MHQAPILTMDLKNNILATGSADSTINCYNLTNGNQTHAFKGHSGVVSTVKLHPLKNLLVSGSNDNTIRVWDLDLKKCVGVLDLHVSVVRDLCFHGSFLYSCSRDQVVIKWDLDSMTSILTIPCFEQLESCKVVNWNSTNLLVAIQRRTAVAAIAARGSVLHQSMMWV